jgi:small nuclear ribonucleoprotein (snRNP)-like protein
MKQQTIKTIKKGEYIKRKPDAKAVYIRGEYCRISKAYSCIDADDMNREIFIKGDKIVFVGFTY